MADIKSKLIDLTLLNYYDAKLKEFTNTNYLSKTSADPQTILSDVSFGGGVNVSGDVDVSGDADFQNNLSVRGDLYVAGTQHVVDVEAIESQSNLFVANSNNSNLSALGGAGFIARIGDAKDPNRAYAVAYYDVSTDSVRLGEGSYTKAEYSVSSNQFVISGTTYTIGPLDNGNGFITPGNIEVTSFIFSIDGRTYEIHRNRDGTYKSVVSQSFTFELTDGQAIATRTDLVNEHIPQWDGTNYTLVDSGSSVGDLVPKTTAIAGLELRNSISKDSLLQALDLDSVYAKLATANSFTAAQTFVKDTNHSIIIDGQTLKIVVPNAAGTQLKTLTLLGLTAEADGTISIPATSGRLVVQSNNNKSADLTDYQLQLVNEQNIKSLTIGGTAVSLLGSGSVNISTAPDFATDYQIRSLFGDEPKYLGAG